MQNWCHDDMMAVYCLLSLGDIRKLLKDFPLNAAYVYK